MAVPEPAPGLVIGYAYLWRDEALKGRDEGRKDRPCVIVLGEVRDRALALARLGRLATTARSE